METREDSEFTKGFNHGYVLGQHEPELLAGLLKDQPQGQDYTDGLREGAKQHARELERERIRGDIERGRQGPERGRGRGR